MTEFYSVVSIVDNVMLSEARPASEYLQFSRKSKRLRRHPDTKACPNGRHLRL